MHLRAIAKRASKRELGRAARLAEVASGIDHVTYVREREAISQFLEWKLLWCLLVFSLGQSFFFFSRLAERKIGCAGPIGVK